MPEANITGFEPHPANPDWIRLTYADGSASPYAQDPDGSFRQEASTLAQKTAGQVPGAPSPLAGNPLAMPVAGPASMPTAAPPVPPVAPAGALAGNPLAMPAAASPPAVQGAPEGIARPGLDPSQIAPAPITSVMSLNELPPDAQKAAREEERHRVGLLQADLSQQRVREAAAKQRGDDAAQASGARPYSLVMTGPAGGGTETTRQYQVSGLTGADKKTVDAANMAAVEGQHDADTAALKARTEQLNNEWDRLSEQEKGKLAEEKLRKEQEADFTTKVDAQTKKLNDLTSKPVDPSLAFQGAGGWYAFMAAFGDAVQNFGAALSGRGPVANPGAHIDSIMERSVQQQTQQQEQMFRSGKLTADQLNADRDYVRAHLATVGKQLADIQLQKAHNADEKTGLSAMGEKFEADRKAAIARNAAATARTMQVGGSQVTKPGQGGGISMFLGEKPDWDAVKAHSEKESGADQVERGVGRAEKANGWTWDEKANHGAGGYLGADGKPVTTDSADPSGISIGGTRFKFGEGARELDGALNDMAAGGAKVKDPIGAVSDKSVDAEKEAMAASTDAGILRAMERTRRNLRGMRAGIDSGFSPGVVNASRYRKAAEVDYRGNQPGLPRSRAATAEDLRSNP